MTTFKKLFAAMMLAASTQAFAIPTLSVNAVPSPVVSGGKVDLAVNISDITDLYGYQFTLSFDAALLKASGVKEGAFLSGAGTTFSDGGKIDNATGTISFVFNTLVGAGPGASGSGQLGLFSFDTFGNGNAALTFSDVLFLDANLNEIAVAADGGSVRVVPEPGSFLLIGIGLVAAGVVRRGQQAARV
ncbi:cohesin domain-containing protein [Massilia rubra]|uniref:PEP-CTERM sorting domain-containing protein n=1 Tax=Massilia rubra TaxID=2607910 RepID=A0ABX0LM11_9BURK|nr:cohesin domain-containing protein [Massilia rubra]NHZ33450.1 PEP-CTERM sorting domain-containing protein [Massilia rubra]